MANSNGMTRRCAALALGLGLTAGAIALLPEAATGTFHLSQVVVSSAFASPRPAKTGKPSHASVAPLPPRRPDMANDTPPTMPAESMIAADTPSTGSISPVGTYPANEPSNAVGERDPMNVEEAQLEIAAAKRKTSRPTQTSLRILQIGDSHTAADFFTGEARRILQAQYGNGGPGYLEAGRPHAGVRNSAISVSASSGWTYSALQKSSSPQAFYLSGFNATATRADETLTLTSEAPIPSDLIEIELTVGPGQGSIEINIDDLEPIRRSLAADRPDRIVLRTLISSPQPLRRLEIRTISNDPVTISSVGVFNSTGGLSYSRVGFPGATIDIINKMDQKIFADELKRLSPDLIVLAFGTNEGFNDNLNLDQYASRYRAVIGKIRAVLPSAKIVLIAPPHASRKKGGSEDASAEDSDCGYQVPPNLDRVRSLILDIARQGGLMAWDWSSIMPSKCGPKQWTAATPKLMAGDYVHLTKAGYELSARSFVNFLEPVIAQLTETKYALSNH